MMKCDLRVIMYFTLLFSPLTTTSICEKVAIWDIYAKNNSSSCAITFRRDHAFTILVVDGWISVQMIAMWNIYAEKNS